MLLLENSEWVEQNFGGSDLGHVARTARLKKTALNMLECPDSSLPTQNADWSDLKAAYRLFDRPEATLESIASCHWRRTRKSLAKRCLLISDTTDINHYSHDATEGLGMLGDGKGRGLQLHSCLMVDGENKNIEGIAGAMTYYRKRVPKKETRAQRLKRTRESQLWGNLVKDVGCPPDGSTWIHVFDRGGDNYEALCNIVEQKCEWIIRAGKLNRSVLDVNGNKVWLGEAVKSAKELGRYELTLRSRPGQAARIAKLKVSSTSVTFPRPTRCSKYVKQCGIKEIKTNVVMVEEVNAPKGVEPIRWILLTSLPINTFNQAWQVIDDYETRWTIEEYHKVIKTGCNIEGHALRTAERLEALIGLISIVGVRLLSLKTQARNAPESAASRRVPSMWLKALKAMRPKLKLSELTAYAFFRELAKLGGFLGRKHDGEPGWQTIWRGYTKLQMIVKGIEIANSNR